MRGVVELVRRFPALAEGEDGSARRVEGVDPVRQGVHDVDRVLVGELQNAECGFVREQPVGLHVDRDARRAGEIAASCTERRDVVDEAYLVVRGVRSTVTGVGRGVSGGGRLGRQRKETRLSSPGEIPERRSFPYYARRRRCTISTT